MNERHSGLKLAVLDFITQTNSYEESTEAWLRWVKQRDQEEQAMPLTLLYANEGRLSRHTINETICALGGLSARLHSADGSASRRVVLQEWLGQDRGTSGNHLWRPANAPPGAVISFSASVIEEMREEIIQQAAPNV